jgi:hypothetical protein
VRRRANAPPLSFQLEASIMKPRRPRQPNIVEAPLIEDAIKCMARGAVLVCEFQNRNKKNSSTDFYLLGHGKLRPAVARFIINRPDVVGAGDGLPDAASQTYRIRP